MENSPNKTSHDIRTLTNQELIHKIDFLTKEERRITVEVLRLLREIERRQLFAELGHPSLFSYCTRVLLYSEAAACRRIEAMRALRETPEIETKLESGELSLSVVTQARATIRSHEKFAKTKVTSEDRKAVMLSLSGQSKREAEKALALEFSTPLSATPVVQRETSRGTTRVTIEFTEEEMNFFDEIKRLSGRPQDLKATVLRLAAKELTQLKKSRGEVPVRKKRSRSDGEGRSPVEGSSTQTEESPSPAEVEKEAAARGKYPPTESMRAIPVATKRSVWLRADGRCEYRNVKGERCEAKHALEYDHITPVALGGQSTSDNLRVYCRQHNMLSATRILGPKLMAAYIPAIR